MNLKINYTIEGNNRYVIGTKTKEDDYFIYIKGTRNNKMYVISKKNIDSITEVD
jgi:hypothetical protein